MDKVTLDEYVRKHHALDLGHLRCIDLCGFNHSHIELPLSEEDRSGKLRGFTKGDGLFGHKPEGYIPSRGPVIFFSTIPLDAYLSVITVPWIERKLDLQRRGEHGMGYAINVFVPREDLFDEFCNTFREKLPAEIKIDESNKSDNDEGRWYGGHFIFRELHSDIQATEEYEGKGRIKQYTSGFGGRYASGFIYPNQIQVNWNGSPESTIRLIRAVADLVKEKRYETHLDLPVDYDGHMSTKAGITGSFYKPK